MKYFYFCDNEHQPQQLESNLTRQPIYSDSPCIFRETNEQKPNVEQSKIKLTTNGRPALIKRLDDWESYWRSGAS